MACAAEEQKRRKYASLIPMYNFSPVGIETLGAWGKAARELVHQIGTRVFDITGDPRARSFLVQRFALDIQRGNVASVMATLPSAKDWEEMQCSKLRPDTGQFPVKLCMCLDIIKFDRPKCPCKVPWCLASVRYRLAILHHHL